MNQLMQTKEKYAHNPLAAGRNWVHSSLETAVAKPLGFLLVMLNTPTPLPPAGKQQGTHFILKNINKTSAVLLTMKC